MSNSSYLGSAIIDLEGLENTHPDPFHAFCPLCKTQATRLSEIKLTTDNFHHLAWKYRPVAVVSQSSWDQKRTLETISFDGQIVLRRLKVPGIHIVKNIPFLRLLSAAQSAELRNTIYGFRIPSIEVDFYRDGKPCLRQLGNQSSKVIRW